MSRPSRPPRSSGRSALGGPRRWAASLAIVAVVLTACTAQRDPDAAAAGPGHTDAALDAADLHYLPTRLSRATARLGAELAIERVGDGYRFTATAPDQSFEVEVTPSGIDEVRQSEIGGAGRRAAYVVDAEAGTIGWTDPLATVAITALGSGRDELEQLADSVLLVDTPTFETWVDDPAHRFGSGDAELAGVPLASRELGISLVGSLADFGLSLELDGVGPGWRTDVSLVTVDASAPAVVPFSAWRADGRNRALLYVPDGFERLTSELDSLRWWQGEDARLGRFVLLDANDDVPIEIKVEVAGRADEQVVIDRRYRRYDRRDR